ncbi:aldo/keto reductase [soil metagenome]
MTHAPQPDPAGAAAATTFPSSLTLPLVLGGNVFGWTADAAQSFAVLDAFVAAGGTQIDTADSYSAWVPGHLGGESETILGQWLASRRNRDQVFIATKVGALTGLDNLAPDTISRAVDDSLRRLQTDYLDLYWGHRDDQTTPQHETLQAFDTLVRAGKVRFLGASNFSAERLQAALDISAANGLASYVAIQPLYNLLEHADFEAGVGKVAGAHGLATLPYSALASGFLTGKYRPDTQVDSPRAAGLQRYANERGYAVVDALGSIAAAHDTSIATVALAWLAQQDTVLAPIASARNLDQLPDLLALADLTLSEQELATLRSVAA